MILAITGTPGCGKTTVAELLRGRGHDVRRVEDVVDPSGKDGDELLFDDDDLSNARIESGVVPVFVEGHLAHYIPNDLTVILRCSPKVLEPRLVKRGYAPEKVRDNVEAEQVDVIAGEVAALERRFVQLDATNRTPEQVSDIIEGLARGGTFENERVDWLESEGAGC